MLTGDELREARERARLTQQQLADRIGKTLRSVGNWERAGQVPRGAETLVRDEFPEWFGQPAAPLSSVSDAQLLAEIARRFDRGRQERDGHGQQPASITDISEMWGDVEQDLQGVQRAAAKRGKSRGRQGKRQADDLGEESQE